MAEGAYEHGSEYGFDVTPLWIRRQAYYSYLAGAHHTYGHNDSWRVLPTWKQALDAPGATQLGLLKKIFLDRKEWWQLVPDQAILASGGNTNGQILNLAARHKDGRWIMVYLGSKAIVFHRHEQTCVGESSESILGRTQEADCKRRSSKASSREVCNRFRRRTDGRTRF